MDNSKTSIVRSASVSDAAHMAKLIDIAGEGIPSWLWSKSSTNAQTPLDVGIERARRKSGGFSFTNAQIAETNGHVAGMLLGYPIMEAPDDNPDDLPAPIAPFVELEKHSAGTWYVNALAVFGEYQNQGIGGQMMRKAEELAQEEGLSTMSIQVYGQNRSAVRLYERLGYSLSHKAPVREHPCHPYYTGDVLLLMKAL